MLPEQFIDSLSWLPSREAEALVAALDGESPTSIRLNRAKVDSLAGITESSRRIAWCNDGLMLASRPSFTLDGRFHAGAYYVQEAASMFVEHMVRTLFDRTEGLRILDMCAAPGGKATLYSSLVGSSGVVVANEPIRQRASILVENVRKWGLGNTVVTCNDPAHFDSLSGMFDIVAVDAPCSGEGMFRKDTAAREQWSLHNVNLCAERQKKILGHAFDTLREDGVLIYSTCTFNRTENEQNIDWLMNNFDVEAVDIPTPDEWNILKTEVGNVKCFRFLPGRTNGEGFFVTAVRKTAHTATRRPTSSRSPMVPLPKKLCAEAARWIDPKADMSFATVADNVHAFWNDTLPLVKLLVDNLTAIYAGVRIGQMFDAKLKPDHPLALFVGCNRTIVPRVELDCESVLRYLRKEDIDVELLAQGMNLLCYETLPIGWIKRIGARANNLYPKSLRILKPSESNI